jgi:DNA-binding IclR family transcriptional regulator
VPADSLTTADIQAVSRASRILGLFDVGRPELVTADVADALGLNRTTTHRYLTSMAAVGLLGQGSRPSSYVVGPLATRLGARAIGAMPVTRVAPKRMQALSDDLAATVTLALPVANRAMIVHVAAPRTDGAVLTIRPGTVLPESAAQSVVLAAFRGRGFEDVRRSGLSVVRDRGVVAVAAPVFDASGVCAAASVASLAGPATEAAVPERARRLREMAEWLTAQLGGSVRRSSPDG